jgi:hypothetical protein
MNLTLSQAYLILSQPHEYSELQVKRAHSLINKEREANGTI